MKVLPLLSIVLFIAACTRPTQTDDSAETDEMSWWDIKAEASKTPEGCMQFWKSKNMKPGHNYAEGSISVWFTDEAAARNAIEAHGLELEISEYAAIVNVPIGEEIKWACILYLD